MGGRSKAGLAGSAHAEYRQTRYVLDSGIRRNDALDRIGECLNPIRRIGADLIVPTGYFASWRHGVGSLPSYDKTLSFGDDHAHEMDGFDSGRIVFDLGTCG